VGGDYARRAHGEGACTGTDLPVQD
jgi:hypothetical protein